MIEINKCYPLQFENVIIPSLKTEEEKQICRAVLKMDEDEIQRVVSSFITNSSLMTQGPPKREESKQYQSTSTVNSSLNLQKSQPFQSKELSIVGKEILQGASANQA